MTSAAVAVYLERAYTLLLETDPHDREQTAGN
jgi:hypothetical protein